MSRRCAREKCNAWAIKGGTVCNKHGGTVKSIRSRANVRHELSQWTLGDPVDDPGETLLRLITQSRIRAGMYAEEIDRLTSEDPTANLSDVLVGESKIWTGESVETVGDYIRGIVQLEAAERDRCARFCKLAIDAGLAERMVRVAERQAETVAAAVREALAESGLDEDVRRMVTANVGRHLRALAS